ncbi:hypothetical protein ASPSYDRAFT_88983 [Aspergillus sydowii CBS 593.65]|uniref:Zn(2)-C6 fungal-type domain-containing protein n=1 Tax=Aspergillus sydowii CBS 593.65 TaxID=1036612 RepID=A0A1L9TL39_9EURO|nr:uncharacterized protein ASPSYDRAFT_88983 [Aspergillus sydowii CBS 593.65]OJJ60101.1 hypothetical protein ASPSYDRAFT_88983 [Aspergillus sydowii CBS 593.65]
MPVRSQSRITTACNSCRLRKQKCSGNKPKCIQCFDHGRNCDWPEQLKRGPAKGYIESLERRLHDTENVLLGLLEQVTDSQLAGIPHPTAQLRSGKRGSEYWGSFPLRSVQEIRSWQEDCQRSAPEHASTSTPTPCLDQPGFVTPAAVDAPVTQEQSQRLQAQESPEPQPSVSAWSGAPSANFQQQFLW